MIATSVNSHLLVHTVKMGAAASYDYDVVILGAGSAGISAAKFCARYQSYCPRVSHTTNNSFSRAGLGLESSLW